MAHFHLKFLEKVKRCIGCVIDLRCGTIAKFSHSSKDSKKVEKAEEIKPSSTKNEEEDVTNYESKPNTLYPWKTATSTSNILYWSERVAVKRSLKSESLAKKIMNPIDFLCELRSYNEILKVNDIGYLLKKKQMKRLELSQKFLPQRKAILKDDLAAAHFIVARGGSVQFQGNNDWMKFSTYSSLPCFYIPGYKVKAIDAENTILCREGLQNLSQLNHLTWLSLKGLKHMDDWCMDWITKEFEKLTYLDISNCENITHRGLSCFYRFQCLKTLNVTGVSDTAEFKVACLMLQDIMPDLEILGIDLKIPDKLDPIDKENIKEISSNQELPELKKF